MHHKIPYSIAILGALLLIPASPPRAAYADATELATVSMGPGGIQWRPLVASDGFTLTVAGADRWIHSEFEAGEMPVFQPFDASGQPLPDGEYTWELRVVRRGSGADPDAEASGRPDAPAGARPRQEPIGPIVQSGGFTVLNGTIVAGGTGEADPGGSPPPPGDPTPRDQVIPDDLIVQGSTCVGLDCVNNEDFGFDTIRLKENNTRLQFDDTSATAGFPSNNWQIRANDDESGGPNFLAFVDQGASGSSESGTIVFSVEAGAGANALYVDNTGRVGFGTATPVLDLHVQTGNTPALRLAQDASSGFTPQTWDVAGNEANFFVRDITGGSRLPLRIRPGALTSSVDISPNGVGIGTDSPTTDLDIHDLDGNNFTAFRLTQGTETWAVSHNGSTRDLVFNRVSSPGPEVVVRDRNHPTATLAVQGPVQATAFNTSSSRAFKTAFEALDPQEVLAKLAALPISAWRFNWEVDSKRHVGPMAEDFQRFFGLGDGKTIATVDADGVTMAAVQGLKQVVDATRAAVAAKDAEIAALKQANTKMATRLAAIEARLADLEP